MGRVSIWAQWSILAAGVMAFPVLLLLTPCLIGWLLLRRRAIEQATEAADQPNGVTGSRRSR